MPEPKDFRENPVAWIAGGISDYTTENWRAAKRFTENSEKDQTPEGTSFSGPLLSIRAFIVQLISFFTGMLGGKAVVQEPSTAPAPQAPSVTPASGPQTQEQGFVLSPRATPTPTSAPGHSRPSGVQLS